MSWLGRRSRGGKRPLAEMQKIGYLGSLLPFDRPQHDQTTDARSTLFRPKAAVHASSRCCGATSQKRTFEQVRSILLRSMTAMRDFAAFCLCLYCGRRNLSQMRYETRGDAAGFSKPAVQEQQTRRISGPPLAAIIFSPQPVQECLCALRHRLIREQ